MSRVYRLLSPREASAESPGAATEAKEGELAIATGAERDVLRAELRQFLREEIKRLEEEYQQRQAELAEITPALRDSMLVPKHPQTALLARLGDSDLRQLRFVTGLLMKLKAEAGRKPAEDGGPPAKDSRYPTI